MVKLFKNRKKMQFFSQKLLLEKFIFFDGNEYIVLISQHQLNFKPWSDIKAIKWEKLKNKCYKRTKDIILLKENVFQNEENKIHFTFIQKTNIKGGKKVNKNVYPVYTWV